MTSAEKIKTDNAGFRLSSGENSTSSINSLEEFYFLDSEARAYAVFFLALAAFVAQIQLARRLFPSFRVFFRERAVALHFPDESSLAFCGRPSRLSFCFFNYMSCVFPAERAVPVLVFRYQHNHACSITPFFSNNSFKGSGRLTISFSF